jgi:hypothetical protein
MRSFSAKSSAGSSQIFAKIGLPEERFSKSMPFQLLVAPLWLTIAVFLIALATRFVRKRPSRAPAKRS